MTDAVLTTGAVVWALLEPVRGREQGGHRPVLVLSGPRHLETVTTLAVVSPLTTTDRGWPNHILATGPHGLDRPTWVMTEQIRTISRDRVTGVAGEVSDTCLAAVRVWTSDFLDL